MKIAVIVFVVHTLNRNTPYQHQNLRYLNRYGMNHKAQYCTAEVELGDKIVEWPVSSWLMLSNRCVMHDRLFIIQLVPLAGVAVYKETLWLSVH